MRAVCPRFFFPSNPMSQLQRTTNVPSFLYAGFSSDIENLADRPEVSRACVSMLPSIIGMSLWVCGIASIRSRLCQNAWGAPGILPCTARLELQIPCLWRHSPLAIF